MGDTPTAARNMTGSNNRQDFEIDDLLQFQVVTLGNKLGLSILRRALAPNNLSIREWRVICVMFIYGPSMARQISEITALDPAHVSRTVHQLKRRGIVSFHDNPDDKRQIIVDLTDEGTDLARDVLPQVTELSNSIREVFSADEFTQLIGYLQRANDHVDQMLATEPD